MRKPKLKFAMFGTGMRSECLINVYGIHPDVEFTAFCDRADGLAETAAAQYKTLTGKDTKVYHSYEELMKHRDFDAMIITTDPDEQVPYACDAMERGIHVMTEVPAAYTIEQCYDLVKTVRKTGAKYQIAEQTRYWSFIRDWRTLAEAETLGKIIHVEGQYLHYEKEWDFFVEKATGRHVWCSDNSLASDDAYEKSWRYRSFMHPIFYLPHTLSPLLSITGGRIERVSCMGTRPGSYCADGIEGRDIETAVMYNSNDVVFNVRVGFTSPHSTIYGTHAHWYNVKGTKGSVEWSRSMLDKPKMWTLDEGWKEMPWTLESQETEKHLITDAHGGADAYPMDRFVKAILNDTVPPMDVYKAVETAAPAILAAKSSENGGAMYEVPDFRAK